MHNATVRRVALALPLVFGAVATPAQTSLFRTLRPDVTVVVTKHPTGADLVEMTYLDGGYPPTLVQTHVDRLGQFLKSNPRGLAITRVEFGAINGKPMTRANFAVDGLIDRDRGLLRLEPLIKAVAGAPSPYTIKGMTIIFAAESPGSTTVKNLPAGGPVQVQGRSVDPRIGTEFRVKLETQDPTKIVIPEGDAARPVQTRSNPDRSTNDLWVWTIVGIASVALGALVYSLLLQARSRGPRRRRR